MGETITNTDQNYKTIKQDYQSSEFLFDKHRCDLLSKNNVLTLNVLFLQLSYLFMSINSADLLALYF